jgi:hypothetical protein
LTRPFAIAAPVLVAALAAAPAALAQVAAPPPALVRGVADSLTTVQVEVNEPVDPASVQPADFVLEMVEATRPVTAASVSPDGTRIFLTSGTRWDPGTAGRVQLSGPGVISDRTGIANSANDWVTIGAAPGDFEPPAVSQFRLTPSRNLCWVEGPRCKRPRAAWQYRSSEDGDAFIAVYRGRRLIGTRRYNGQPGSNYINFDGKIGGRRLGPGRYTAQLAVRDQVGNLTPPERQKHTTFTVKRTR